MKCTSCGLELIQANNGSYQEHSMYECVGRLRSALTTAEQRLSVAVKLDADDKDGFDWKVLDRIHDLELQLTTAQEEVKEIQHGFEILSLSNGNLREENKRLHELVVDTYNILNHGRNTTQSENYEVFDRLENEALNGGKND